MKQGYVYILSNHNRTTFYIGVTNDIKRRLYEHKNHLIQGFTDKYNVVEVLYVEQTELLTDAIEREKQLKGWTRAKKINLIKQLNPLMVDLYDTIMQA